MMTRMIERWDGSKTPETRLDPRILLAHDTANELVADAEAFRALVREQKLNYFARIDAYIDLVLESYGARLGGTRGGVTVENLDTTRRVHVIISDYQTVTAAIDAARALMSEILDDLCGDASDDLRALVEAAFARNEKTNRISTERVLGLRRLNLQHLKWPLAREAIADAVVKAGSKRYVRFYRRETPRDAWQQIDLNFSSL